MATVVIACPALLSGCQTDITYPDSEAPWQGAEN